MEIFILCKGHSKEGKMKRFYLLSFLFLLIINISISAQVYTITATTGANGNINPSSSINVNQGSDQSFTITPSSGYQIADVLVDNISVGSLSSYNFTNVSASHTISASFIVTDPIFTAIIGGISGEIEIVDMPSNLDVGQFTSKTHIRLIHEGSGIVTANMPVFNYDGAYHDPNLPIVNGDNTFGNAITIPYSGSGLPAVGTEVYSILLHFDPDLTGLPFNLNEGIGRSATITFNRPILGVYVTSGALDNIDDIFTPSGVIFPSTSARDMEFNYDGDQYSISSDRYQLSLTMFSHNGGILDEMRVVFLANPTVDVMTKIFLEGPYNGGNMSSSFNSVLPLAQPYNATPWNYSGSESVAAGFFTSHTDIVDWVLVKLRKASDKNVVSTRASFIKSDGSIVDLDGTSPVEFNEVVGNFYIAIEHRNHLAVMSANPITLPNSTPYDFTTASDKFYEDNVGAKGLGSGVWGMIAGDGNGNGQIQNDDSENIWKPDNGTSGYKRSDFNMNGQVQNDDNENYWKPNNGRSSQVP